MTPSTPAKRDAIVIGAGIAGLLAARVLADHYDQVTILERDLLPTTIEPRKGVPQSRHAHALLAGGRAAIESLFPGISDELGMAGAVRGHGRFFSGGGFHARLADAPRGLYVSRPMLESTIRTRIRALPNVSIHEGCHVRSLMSSADGARVTGLRVVHKTNGEESIIPAAIVVDASGRSSNAADWLTALGYPAPEVDTIEVGMGYSTRFYQRTSEHLNGDVLVNIAPTPSNPRACGMMAQEGDRWIVTLAGYFGDYPPTDEAGFLEFARSLPTADVYETIRTATPLTDPQPFRFVSNRWQRFDRLNRFPAGFLVVGDAIASFTPIYGQGMTVAAREALALQACLAQGDKRLAERFFRESRKIIAIAWSISVGNDLKLSPQSATRPLPDRVIGWYIGKLQRVAHHDAQLAMAFQQVANLLQPPPSLLRPSVMLRVIRGSIGQRPRPVSGAAPAVEPTVQATSA